MNEDIINEYGELITNEVINHVERFGIETVIPLYIDRDMQQHINCLTDLYF